MTRSDAQLLDLFGVELPLVQATPPGPVHRVGAVGGVLHLDSAPFVTGEVLHVDGGQSAGH